MTEGNSLQSYMPRVGAKREAPPRSNVFSVAPWKEGEYIESHSEKYYDGKYEYKTVLMTEQQYRVYRYYANKLRTCLLDEETMFKVGISQSPGWQQYQVFRQNPQVLFLRRKLDQPLADANRRNHATWLRGQHPALARRQRTGLYDVTKTNRFSKLFESDSEREQ